MKRVGGLRLISAMLFVLLGAAPQPHSRYVIAWATETRDPLAGWYVPGKMGHDILAVFDVSAPGTASFGKIVGFLSTNGDVRMAHHSNYELPPDNVFYANDWLANKTFVFDVHDAEHPKLLRRIGNVGTYSYPHTFVQLANGNTLATFNMLGVSTRARVAWLNLTRRGAS